LPKQKLKKIKETITSPLPGLDANGNLFQGTGEGDVKIFARINKKGKGHFRASGKGETENATTKRQVVRNSPVVAAFAKTTAEGIVGPLADFKVKRSVLVFRKPSVGMSVIRLAAAGSFTVN